MLGRSVLARQLLMATRSVWRRLAFKRVKILQKLLIELRAVLEIVGVDLAGCGQRQRRLGAVEQADAEFLFRWMTYWLK